MARWISFHLAALLAWTVCARRDSPPQEPIAMNQTGDKEVGLLGKVAEEEELDPVEEKTDSLRQFNFVPGKPGMLSWLRHEFLFYLLCCGFAAFGVSYYHGDQRAIKLYHWVMPFLMFASCFLLQSVLLRVATAYYVDAMEIQRGAIAKDFTSVSKHSYYDLSASIKEGNLHDVMANWLGFHRVPLAALDICSAFIPACWAVLCIHRGDLAVWTKCLTCGSLLAVGKGTLGVLTIVPDSIGWTECKRRLGGLDDPQGWSRVKDAMHFHSLTAELLSDLLFMELFGAVLGTEKAGRTRLRFCADMMYSGHTYFVINFSLGLYELIWKATRKEKLFNIPMQGTRNYIRGALACALVGMACLEACLVTMNRFHYTTDIVVAILLCFLWHGHVAVGACVKHWVGTTPNKMSEEDTDDDEEADTAVAVLPCCVPFCCFAGRYKLVLSEDS